MARLTLLAIAEPGDKAVRALPPAFHNRHPLTPPPLTPQVQRRKSTPNIVTRRAESTDADFRGVLRKSHSDAQQNPPAVVTFNSEPGYRPTLKRNQTDSTSAWLMSNSKRAHMDPQWAGGWDWAWGLQTLQLIF